MRHAEMYASAIPLIHWRAPSTRSGAVKPIEVSITSDGLQLAGHLRLPAGSPPFPAVVLTGPLTGVKEQVVGRYSAGLTARGFATLAFDHRSFGASEGMPRNDESVGGKLADLRDAATFLAVHPLIDATRLGVVGVCLGGGYALRAAAADRRLRAVATVAGCFNDPEIFRSGMGADAYHDTLRRLAEQLTDDARSGETGYMKAVTEDDDEAAMGGREPWEYYGTDRGAVAAWENRLTKRSIRELLTFDAAGAAGRLAPVPLLIVHGRADDYCSPEAATTTAERHGAADLVWLETTEHIDLYDVDLFVEAALDRLGAWFGTHLNQP